MMLKYPEYNRNQSISTEEQIDFSNFSQLKIEWEQSNSTQGTASFGITTSRHGSSINTSKKVEMTGNFSKTESVIDISDYNENGYLIIRRNFSSSTTDENAKLTIHKITFIK